MGAVQSVPRGRLRAINTQIRVVEHQFTPERSVRIDLTILSFQRT